VVALVAGFLTSRRRETLARDAISLPALILPVWLALSGVATRDAAGIVLVLFIALRLAPLAAAIVAWPFARAVLAGLLAFAFYAPLGAWTLVSTYAQGDQPHFLLAAESLRRGELDLTPLYRDGTLFEQLSGARPTPDDLETHAFTLPAGTRLPQGYAFPLVLLPGWVAAGRLGALLIVAAIAAAAAGVSYALAREVAGDRPATRAAWLCLAALAPFSTLATHLYPNVLGALALAVAFRLGVSAPARRPFVAGVAAGATFMLTPRDALTAALLLGWMLVADRRGAVRLAAGIGAAALVAGAFDLVTFGIPVPFAGYIGGLFAFAGTRESAVWLRPDYGLLGMLFDRAFGLAGSAPWVFAGALGVVPLVRAAPRAASALLLATLGTLAGLAFYRLWEGGWGPPNRYLADVLPLWCPFVAAGFAAARWWARAIAAVLVTWSAFATLAFLGVPTWSYSVEESRLVEVLGASLPLGPLASLPSYHVPGASPIPGAIALLAAVVLVAALGSRGRRLAPA